MTINDDAPEPTPKRMNWGDEIRKIREGQDLSQRRLGKLADVDRASLLHFEKDASRCNLELAESPAGVSARRKTNSRLRR
jgi:DNA-binding XRE family transcriptional regulator